MPEPVLVFDLDGTILRGNSYRFWVKQMLLGPFAHLPVLARLKLRLRVLALVVARKALRCPHARIKGELRRIWMGATSGDPQSIDLGLLLAALDGDVRPWFSSILRRVASGGCDAILATAAAAEYAVPFARRLGFVEVLATASEPRLFKENLGEAKADAVEKLIRARGWDGRPVLVFTDHADDLPLIRLANYLVWFGDAAALPAMPRLEAGPGAIAFVDLSPGILLEQLDSGTLDWGRRTVEAPMSR